MGTETLNPIQMPAVGTEQDGQTGAGQGDPRWQLAPCHAGHPRRDRAVWARAGGGRGLLPSLLRGWGLGLPRLIYNSN